MKLNIKIKDRLTKIIACIVSAGILFMLYHRLDIQSLRIILERLNYSYLWAILFFSLIIQFLAALRWSLMIRTLCNRLSFYDCFKLTSSSGALNAILPSKLGHFAKVYFMAEKNLIDLRVGISMVFYEKLSDLAVMSFYFFNRSRCTWQNEYIHPVNYFCCNRINIDSHCIACVEYIKSQIC